jgi:hypothetical protein
MARPSGSGTRAYVFMHSTAKVELSVHANVYRVAQDTILTQVELLAATLVIDCVIGSQMQSSQ